MNMKKQLKISQLVGAADFEIVVKGNTVKGNIKHVGGLVDVTFQGRSTIAKIHVQFKFDEADLVSTAIMFALANSGYANWSKADIYASQVSIKHDLPNSKESMFTEIVDFPDLVSKLQGRAELHEASASAVDDDGVQFLIKLLSRKENTLCVAEIWYYADGVTMTVYRGKDRHASMHFGDATDFMVVLESYFRYFHMDLYAHGAEVDSVEGFYDLCNTPTAPKVIPILKDDLVKMVSLSTLEDLFGKSNPSKSNYMEAKDNQGFIYVVNGNMKMFTLGKNAIDMICEFKTILGLVPDTKIHIPIIISEDRKSFYLLTSNKENLEKDIKILTDAKYLALVNGEYVDYETVK